MDSFLVGRKRNLRGVLPIFLLLLTMFLSLSAAARADTNFFQTYNRREQPKAKAESGESQRPRVRFRLSGGAAYLMAKDFNDQMYYSNYFYSKYYLEFCDVTGKYIPIHSCLNFQAEILLDLTTRLRFGLGIGFLGKTQESMWMITYNGEYHIDPYTYTVACRPSIKAVPITLGIRYDVTNQRPIRLEAIAGLGLYPGTIGLDYSETATPYSPAIKETWKGRDCSLGFQGGLSLGFQISPDFSAFVEVLGRLAQFRNPRGTAVVDGKVIENATLWLSSYSHVISDKNPNVYYSGDFDQAMVDLSGYSVRGGLEIRLGRR
jgi:hypothetical protein